MVDALVLTIDRAYFDLTGGLERWLYRLVRKHGGRQQYGWSFDFRHLHLKSGSLSPYKRFAFELRDIVRRQPLPGYQLGFAPGAVGQPRLTFQPTALQSTSTPRVRAVATSTGAQAVNRPVLSGTRTPVRSGTADPYYREPKPDLSSGTACQNRAPNFANIKSFGFLLTRPADCGSPSNDNTSAAPSPSSDRDRLTSRLAAVVSTFSLLERAQSGNLGHAATVEVAP